MKFIIFRLHFIEEKNYSISPLNYSAYSVEGWHGIESGAGRTLRCVGTDLYVHVLHTCTCIIFEDECGKPVVRDCHVVDGLSASTKLNLYKWDHIHT